MVSYWDVLPPEMKEPILFWKAVAEQLGPMKTVMKELESLCICPMTDYAAILKNNPSKPAEFYPVFNILTARGIPDFSVGKVHFSSYYREDSNSPE